MNIWESLAKQEKVYWSHKDETLKFWQYVSKGMPFVVFDVETTGLKKGIDRIIEFSAIRMEKVAKVYQKTAEIEQFIKPPFVMDSQIIDIHGITNEFLEDKPEESEVYATLRDFLSDDAAIMGYNVSFDVSFVNSMFARYGASFKPVNVIDVFTLVKENIFTDEHANKRKLSDIAQLLLPNKTFQFHDSSEDIIATWEVGTKILKRFVKSHSIPESSKSKGKIIRYEAKNYGKWKGIFVTIVIGREYYDLHYDIKQSCWVQKCNMIPVFNMVDMDDIEKQMNEIARKKGKSYFHLLNDSYDVRNN